MPGAQPEDHGRTLTQRRAPECRGRRAEEGVPTRSIPCTTTVASTTAGIAKLDERSDTQGKQLVRIEGLMNRLIGFHTRKFTDEGRRAPEAA